MAASQNILILTSSTGGGHQSAASALQDSLMRLAPEQVLIEIYRVLEESSGLSRKFSDVYNYLLRHHQHLVKYYYWAIERMKPHESNWVLRQTLDYGMQVFERVCPNAIVSVHPMTQHFCAYVLKRLNLLNKIPLISVVTDPCYGFWQAWACDEVDQYYVASDAAKQQLVDFGVTDGRIKVVGMPVDNRFHPVDSSEKLAIRKSIGLEPDKFTVFVNAGWIGGGNIPAIYKEMLKSDLPVQAIFLAGRNEKLRQQAQEMASASKIPVKVLGYSEEMPALMNASDVMISKLGGLTTFEALASELPIISDGITPPMPQEEKTVKFVESVGAGKTIYRPGDVVGMLYNIIHTPSELASMKLAARENGTPGASDRIAKDLLACINS